MLGPEDMVNPHVDERSMMTYLSQFPEAQLKPGAPIKTTPKLDPSQVKVSGPGIKGEGLTTGLPAVFYVDTKEAGTGKLQAAVEGPNGVVEVRMEDKKDGTYTCSYVPLTEGGHQVTITWSDLSIDDSPFLVEVSPGTNAKACRAYGPGVEGSDLKDGTSAEFWVETAGAGEGDLAIAVRGPKGPLQDIQCLATKESVFQVKYTPPSPGQYIVEVTFAGLHIKDSPFKVRVGADKPDASKCYAEGPGVESEELAVDQETWFLVHTKGAGRGELTVNTRGPHGEVPTIATEMEPGVTKYMYTPRESGELVITVKYGGRQIPGSRFRVQVKPPPRPDKCIATGPGLAPRGVRVNEPAVFHVKTKDAGSGDVEVTITGPSGQIPFDTQSSLHVYDFTYKAEKPGQYSVEIKFAGQDIPGSPYPVAITDSSKVKITGPGMNGEPLLANSLLKYSIDARGAGPGDIACHIKLGETDLTTDNEGPKVTKLVEEGTFEINYKPTEVGLQKMNVTFNEAPIPDTPIRISIYDPTKVVAKGPGLESGNKTGETTHFIVDMQQAGEGHLHIRCGGPVDTPLFIKDQANDIIRCEYTPTIDGDYVIDIFFENEHILNSPYYVDIKQKTNPAAVIASGPGLEPTGLTTDTLAEFYVDYSKAGDGEVQVKIEGPAGGVEFQEEEVEDGITQFYYHTDPDEAGLYVIDIAFADEAIPNSPYHVPVKWKPDPIRVIAEGTGLEGGTSNEWAEFTLDLRKAGEGSLDINIVGPSEADVKCKDQEDGTVAVQYFPELAGVYAITIHFNNTHIPGSPFKPLFELATDSAKCKAFGDGLREHGVKIGDPGNFLIDTTEAGSGAVDVIVDGPHGTNQQILLSPAKPLITSNKNETYSVVYNPRKVGKYGINVTFADNSIPGSPFPVNVTDPTKVVLKGPACGESAEVEFSIESELKWIVDCSQAGPGYVEACMNTREEKTEEVLVTKEDDSENFYQLGYQPKSPGSCQLLVTYSGNPIEDSPEIAIYDTSKIKIYGPAFDGISLGETTSLHIDFSEAGDGKLVVNIIGPAADLLERQTNKEDTVATFTLTPSVAGEYQVEVTFGGDLVPRSPFSIPVRDINQVLVSGSGITGETARVGQPADVIVDTSESGPAPVEARVTLPSGESQTIDLHNNDEETDSYCGSYTPTEPGHYCVEVMFNGELLPESPFQVPIGSPESVRLQGDGLEYAFVGEDNIIECFTNEAGPGELSAEFNGSSLVQWYVTPVNDSIQELHYSVDAPGTYEFDVYFNGFPVEEQARQIQAVDLRKCQVSGPGVMPGLCANMSTYFEVDMHDAGQGELNVVIKSSNNDDLPIEITETGKNLYQINYTPQCPGDHNVTIQYNGREVETSPICVPVGDPSQVKCSGSGLTHAIINEPAEFIVDYREAGKGSVNVSIEGPEQVTNIQQTDNSDGTESITYTTSQPGHYSVNVLFMDVPVNGSPFQLECERPPPDALKCIISGLDEPGHFTVDCKDAGGSGLLEVGVCGKYVPVEFVSVKHNGDYMFSVSYDIKTPGKTTISVKWHDQHLTGSPFVIYIKE